MVQSRTAMLALVAVMGTAVIGACGRGEPEAASGPATIKVPRDAATIGEAVGRARPGDLVLVHPGVYRESVHVRTERVTLRGTDRNGVVIDGQVRRRHGVVVTAPGVSVENLTVRGHLLNGVLVTGATRDGGEPNVRGNDGYQRLDPERTPPLHGFRVRYVTAANNGLYGIYAFNARHGTLEHNYASGSADSGFYVGQCKPCHVAVTDNVAEHNAVGYEGTNAGGSMWVMRNRFSHNRVGLTVSSDYLETFLPQQEAVIAGNVVTGNAEPQSPAQADGGFGIGIGIAGGQRNLVVRNLVLGHPRAGLVFMSSEDIAAIGNRIEGNRFERNAVDVVNAASGRAPARDNCVRANALAVVLPPDIATRPACAGDGAAMPAAAVPGEPHAPAGIPFRDVPLPPAQPQLPSASTLPAAEPSTPEPPRMEQVELPPATLHAGRTRSSS